MTSVEKMPPLPSVMSSFQNHKLSTVCEVATQTELYGTSANHYQILQTAQTPSKTCRKRNNRKKNKKAQDFQLQDQNAKFRPELDSSLDPLGTCTFEACSQTSSNVEIVTDSNARKGNYTFSNIPMLLRDPQAIDRLSDASSGSTAYAEEMEKYLDGEEQKLIERLKLCKALKCKISEVRELKSKHGEASGENEPRTSEADLMGEVKVLRAKWIAGLL